MVSKTMPKGSEGGFKGLENGSRRLQRVRKRPRDVVFFPKEVRMAFQMISKVSQCGFESFERVAGSNFFQSEGHPCSQSRLRAASECSPSHVKIIPWESR